MSSKNSKAAKQAALAKLAASKRTGAKLSNLIDLKEEESIYKEVDETEYARIVAERRSNQDFVVDDEGLGYADDGEEHLDNEDEHYDDGDAFEDGGDADLPPAGEERSGEVRSSNRAKISATTINNGQKTLMDFSSGAAAVDISKASKKAKPAAHLDMDALFNELEEQNDVPARAKVFARSAAGMLGASSGRVFNTGSNINPFTSSRMHNYHSAYNGVDEYKQDFSALDQVIDSVPADSYADFSGDFEVSGELVVEEEGAGEGREEAERAAESSRPAARVATQIAAMAPSKARAALAAAAAAAAERAKAVETTSPNIPKTKTLTGANAIAGGWIGGGGDEESAGVTSPSDAAITPGGAGAVPGRSGPVPFERVPMFKRRGIPADQVGLPVNSLLFYWTDAHEERNNGGSIYLFGKIMTNATDFLKARVHNEGVRAAQAAAKASGGDDTAMSALLKEPVPQYASCCVTVSNLERCVFVLPRERRSDTGEPVSFLEVHQELQETMRRHLGPGHKFAAKRVVRNYAFELPDVPREKAEYLKLVYDARATALPATLSGKTFGRIFGAGASSLENFLLKRDIMGPCWLRLFNVSQNAVPISWCQYDVTVDNPKNVVRVGNLNQKKDTDMPEELVKLDAVQHPTPELVVMSMSMKTVVNPKNHQHEIVAMSMVAHKQVNMDGPSRESNFMLSAKTVIRPLSSAQPLPADLRPAINRLDPKIAQSLGVESNERALLSNVLVHISKVDPDVIVGHNIAGFDLDVFLHRCDVNKTQMWSRIGRLRRSNLPKANVGSGGRVSYSGVLAAGRLICDTYLAARELLRETTYTLTSLAMGQLNEKRVDIDPIEVPAFLTATGPEAPLALMQHTELDSRLALKLMFKLQVLPLTKQLTNLAGNLWSRSLRGARAERIEYLLLHEFHKLKYIVPEKVQYGQQNGASKAPADEEIPDQLGDDDDEPKQRSGQRMTGTIARNSKTRAKPSYAGGLVLEPKKGLYDKMVLLLDFNSLYPSIIQEYNICFTTVERPLIGDAVSAAKKAPADGEDGEDDEAEGGSMLIPALPDSSKTKELAVLPRVIRNLVMKRRQVKALMNGTSDPATKQALDIRQKALKILANSMYGCLGFSFSRFYAKPIAALVTSQGREILQRTVNLAQDVIGCEVIYGDTDSIMIYTNTSDIKQVKALGAAVKREVNKLYTHLEIEIDGIFSSMLLLKKKKYAALVATEGPGGILVNTREMKGLDMVRRDWCVLSREIGTQVLDIILSGKEREEIVEEIHALMMKLAADVRAGKYSIDKFTITKGLNKAPQDYPDVKSHPHLQVALAMIKAGKPVNTGDHIPYVICVEASQPGNSPPGAGTSPTSPANGATSPGDTAAMSPSNASGGVPAGSPLKPTVANAALRAYHPDEVQKALAGMTDCPTAAPLDAPLHVDFEWYLTQQILPPIARVCEPIAGTSQARLAECLGLDSSKYNHRGTSSLAKDDDASFVPRYLMTNEERFNNCEKLFVSCYRCNHTCTFAGLTNQKSDTSRLQCGLLCPQKGCDGMLLPLGTAVSAEHIIRTLLPMIPAGVDMYDYARARYASVVSNCLRACVLAHQQGVFFCDDAICPLSITGTRSLTTRKDGFACPRPGCRGTLGMEPKRTYKELHNQIEYFDHMFNANSATKRPVVAKPGDAVPPKLDASQERVYETVTGVVQAFLERSAYHYVSPLVFSYVEGANAKFGIKTKGDDKRRSRALITPGGSDEGITNAPSAKTRRMEM